MKDIEYVLDFATNLGSEMLVSGANLERADDTMDRVCRSYGLTDVSIFSLSSFINISAKSADGKYASRQVSVPAMDIHLEKLDRLNQLSRKVCKNRPEPKKLSGLLKESEKIQEYTPGMILLGRMVAMSSLSMLFGGTFKDMLASDLIVLALLWLVNICGRHQMNNVITNMLSMTIAGSAAILLTRIGIGDHYFIIMMTCCMLLLPGIPIINAARNLLCGNEMNGILDGIKSIIETVALVLGLIFSMFIFGVIN